MRSYRPAYWGGGSYGYGYRRPTYGCGGCLSRAIGLVVLIVILLAFVPAVTVTRMSGCSSRQPQEVTSSTGVQTSNQPTVWLRKKLASTKCIESDQWIDDQAGWLTDTDAVVDAMRTFYDKTGVQPYLVIADSIGGSRDYDEADVESYLRDLYDQLYQDDGHLILLFCESYENEYDPYLLVGADAASVVDTAAENLIYEAIDRWYTDTTLTDDAYFARIFVASANAIMSNTSLSEFDRTT